MHSICWLAITNRLEMPSSTVNRSSVESGVAAWASTQNSTALASTSPASSPVARPNIRRASVEEHVGWMICEIDGDGSHVDAAVAWLVGLGVQVDRLSDVVES